MITRWNATLRRVSGGRLMYLVSVIALAAGAWMFMTHSGGTSGVEPFNCDYTTEKVTILSGDPNSWPKPRVYSPDEGVGIVPAEMRNPLCRPLDVILIPAVLPPVETPGPPRR
jgi:hypothetical protein